MGCLKVPIISSLATVLVLSSPAIAQVPGGPVRQGSGPIRELSTNVGTGSGPVRESGGSVHEGTAGRLSGNPVRGSVTGNLLSGTVSDISAGPVTSGRAISGGSPLREGIAEPVHGLDRLQQQLRAIQPLPREEGSAEEPSAESAAEAPAPEPQSEERTASSTAQLNAAPVSGESPDEADQEPLQPAEEAPEVP